MGNATLTNGSTGANPSFKVLIIGAGTGGASLAHALKRAGIEVMAFERDRTRTSGREGYRVGISPDGSRALHACVPADLYELFVATCARSPRYFNMYSEHLQETLSFGGADLPLGDDPIESEKTVNRSTLRQVLYTGLEEIIQFDKKFTRYEQNANGTVTAFFADGTSETGDLLVAADGTNSRVRQQYLPHAALEDCGMLSMGGKMPMTPEARALLPQKALAGMSMFFAPKGYGLILHVVEFNWDENGAKAGASPRDKELLAQWSGRRYDHPNDYIGWGFWAAKQHFPVDPLKLDGSQLIELTLTMTENWHPNLRKLMAMTDPTTVYPINIRTSVPVAPWPASNITLLGDAIHTMTPGRGAGANTALRDAALLCQKLVAVRNGELTLLQAIGAYEDEMRRYGFAAVQKSRAQMSGDDAIHKPVIGDLILHTMRAGMKVANVLPPLKRRMAAAMFAERNTHAS
ncbi:MAG: FAD-dependent monooxygenase [Caldilineaceae bacterium]|nr:FAD-dependent monooxygenase [Caldilineaceae bacterium]